MQKLFSKILLASFLVATVVAPFKVSAQSFLGSVPVQLQGESVISGFTGIGVGGAASGLNAASSTCGTSEGIASQVSSVLAQGLSLLGDNPAQATALQTQIGVVDAAITCWTGIVTSANSLESTIGGTLFGSQKISTTKEQAVVQIANLKNIRKQLEARLQVSTQGFWKAVLVGLLLKQTDHLSEKLVTELTEKFKINDYSKYVGAVTDTVYINSMILKYVDNDKDRAIVRSMITNPLLRNRIHPSIAAAADSYVGLDIDAVRFDDPEFLNQVNRLGKGEAFKQRYQSSMIAKTDEVISKAREAALSEISQSGGYKTTLNNCGPSVNEQKQKDLQYKQILDEISDREELQRKINNTVTSTAGEKKQIESDVKKARAKLDSFTTNLGKAVVQICEGVNTPSQKFKDTIHDLIGSQIKNFSDYNDNNLPLLQRLVVDIADNLVNKYVFGTKSASTSDLINESVTTLTNGIAATMTRPSTGLNTTIPTFGQDAPSSAPGNVAGVETNTPSVSILPRGPAQTFR